MTIHSLIYTSKPVRAFTYSQKLELEEFAREKNARLGISGFLCFRDNRIFQYLEGNNAALQDLFRTIYRDSRHTVIDSFDLPVRTERIFEKWSMRVIEDERLKITMMSSLLDQFIFRIDLDSIRDVDISFILEKLLPGVAAEQVYHQKVPR